MFSPWTWWFVVELSTNVSPNTLEGTNIIYPLYKKKNSSYQPQWEGWVSPYVSLTYSLHRWVPPSLVLTNYCILQKHVCFEGLYPNMGIISDYCVFSGELEESGASVHRRSKKHLSTTMLCSLSVELHHIKIKVHEAKPILPSRDSKIKQNK